ncbi:MAG: PAS domain S-box protein [Cyclobacteriaceae bacterium]
MKKKEALATVDDKLLANVIDYTNNVVIITDLEGKILYTNKGFSKLTKYEAVEVLGKKPGDFLQGPETDIETVKRIRVKLNNHERVDETIINYSKTGEKYWLKLDIETLRDENGVPTNFLAIESDVTLMKETERLATNQNKRISDNIAYAHMLQDALFRNTELTDTLFEELFIFDQPKDTVGGDFYIFDKIQNKKVIFVGDCTGHGVSGAIMTAIASSIIKSMLLKYKTLSPTLILTKSLEMLRGMLDGGENPIKDSFEGTILFIDEIQKTVRYASIGMDLYLYSDEKVERIKGQKEKVLFENEMISKSERIISYKENDMIYLTTDGFKDQFGGEDDKKFTTRRIQDLLGNIYHLSSDEQYEKVKSEMDNWKNGLPQTDDILMVGIKL